MCPLKVTGAAEQIQTALLGLFSFKSQKGKNTQLSGSAVHGL